MQPFQMPRPSGTTIPNKRPGPPGRAPVGQPGARPGLPKPKNPALIGGKPLMPISSLIQATPYTDPEENTSIKEPIDNSLAVPEQSQGEVLISEKKISDVANTNGLNGKIEDHQKQDKETIEGQNDLNINGHSEHNSHNHLITTGGVENNDSHGLGIETDIIRKSHDKGQLLIKDHKESPSPKPAQGESRITAPEATNEQRVLERKEEEIVSNSPIQKNSQPPSSKIRENGISPTHNLHANNVNHGIQPHHAKKDEQVRQSVERADQEETGDGDQSISPTIYNPEQNEKRNDIRPFEEDQKDTKVDQKPSISFGFNSKPKTVLAEEENEGYVATTTRNTSKESDFKKEEDTGLLAKLKLLEVELEKEKKEKNSIKGDYEKLLTENITLKTTLENTTAKVEDLSRQDSKNQGSTRKEDEINLLKAELKSTMEGSRLITEHSNRVISESTKFKEETEALIASLEQDKEQMHQNFLEYKKQTQEDYVSKIAALQERINYLEEKVRDYEADVENHHVDSRQKAQNINKLALANNDIQSTLSEWPTFHQIYSQLQAINSTPIPDPKLFELEEAKALIKVDQEVETPSKQLVAELGDEEYLKESERLLEDVIQPVEQEKEENALSVSAINAINEVRNIPADDTPVFIESKSPFIDDQYAPEQPLVEIVQDDSNQVQDNYEDEYQHLNPNEQETQHVETNTNYYQAEEPTQPESQGWQEELIITDQPEEIIPPPQVHEEYVSIINAEPQNSYEEPPFETRPEIQGPKVSQDAFCAPPSYRIPQKKKAAGSGKPPMARFVPVQPTYVAPTNITPDDNTVIDSTTASTRADYEEKAQEDFHNNSGEIDQRPNANTKIPSKSKPPQSGRNPFTGVQTKSLDAPAEIPQNWSQSAAKTTPFTQVPIANARRHSNDVTGYRNENGETGDGFFNEAYSNNKNSTQINGPPFFPEKPARSEGFPSSQDSLQFEDGQNVHRSPPQGPKFGQGIHGRSIVTSKVIKKKGPASGSIF